MKLLNFGDAISAMKKGSAVSRKGWNGKGLMVFMQIPANIPVETVPMMQSLPIRVKEEILFRKQTFDKFKSMCEGVCDNSFDSIRYRNQLALLHPDNTITGWAPSASDAIAADWMIIK